MGAVKNAVQRDQQDPTIMDLNPDKSLESQRPPSKANVSDDGPPLNKDPAYDKYFRMLKMVRFLELPAPQHVVLVSLIFVFLL